MGIKRGEAPLENYLPSPLMKGRGIKGEGFTKTDVIILVGLLSIQKVH